MTYKAGDLHGIWQSLDDDSLLKLDQDGDFKVTSADDGSASGNPLSNLFGSISGKWAIEGGNLKLSVRSLKLSKPSLFMVIGTAPLPLFLRLTRKSEIVIGEITRLTDTDLRIESPQGKVREFQKKLKSRHQRGSLSNRT